VLKKTYSQKTPCHIKFVNGDDDSVNDVSAIETLRLRISGSHIRWKLQVMFCSEF
jgi:hypothetical protein